MPTLMLFVYGLYFILVGVHGNADELLTEVSQEKQFVYWLVAIFVVVGLWESPVGGKVAKPFAVLIVLGFLLSNSNYKTIMDNAKNVMSSSTGTIP